MSTPCPNCEAEEDEFFVVIERDIIRGVEPASAVRLMTDDDGLIIDER